MCSAITLGCDIWKRTTHASMLVTINIFKGSEVLPRFHGGQFVEIQRSQKFKTVLVGYGHPYPTGAIGISFYLDLFRLAFYYHSVAFKRLFHK